MQLVHTALVLAGLTALGLAQAPLVSSQRVLRGDEQIGPAGSSRAAPALAAGGGGFLIAWSDSRGELTGGDFARESSDDIWIQRTDGQGVPLSPTPTRVAASDEFDTEPTVTWNGSQWLVVWSVYPLTFTGSYTKLLAVRVDSNGTVLDAQPMTLFSSSFRWHSAASNGQNWAVSVGTQADGIHARTVSTAPVNPLGPITTLNPSFVSTGAITALQSGYLLAWDGWGGANNADILGARFDSALAPVGPAPLSLGVTGLSDSDPLMASNGSEVLLCWSSFDPLAWVGSVRFARVSPSGTVLGTGTLLSNWVAPVAPQSVTWDGTQWFVTLFGQLAYRISAAGVALDPSGFTVRPWGGPDRTALVAAGASTGGVCAAWTEQRATPSMNGDLVYQVVSSRVVSPANTGSDVFPATSAPAQTSPALAVHASGSAVLYRSEISGEVRLMLARQSAQGVALDAQPLQLASAVDIWEPALAFDGSTYLAVWSQAPASGAPSGSIRARRIALDGTLLDPEGFRLSEAAAGIGASTAVAGSNGEFLVIGARVGEAAVWRIRGSDGAILSGPTSVHAGVDMRVAACATPSGFAVAWRRRLGSRGRVQAALVSSTGTVSAPFFQEGGPAHDVQSTSIACSSSGLLVAWDEAATGLHGNIVLARRFDLAGAALDATPLAVAPSPTNEQSFPDVAWDGSQWICAYQERGTASPSQWIESNVRAARIDSAGNVRDPAGFAIESSARSEGQPDVAGLGGARSVVACAVLHPEVPFAAYRIGVRDVTDGCPQPSTFCTAMVNSQQCTPSIAISGPPSATGLGSSVVSATSLLDDVNGLVLVGHGAAAVPFHGGTLCIAAPRLRTHLQNTGAAGSANPCDGQLSFDLNAFIASGADPLLQIPGQYFACQVWSRDPGSPSGTNLTNAVHGQVCW
ncbi:MAG: hypothetical protein IT454_07305 [Planctomycetes bacterium]|nr:hypothetical protein [Planctomycetota bacterium]